MNNLFKKWILVIIWMGLIFLLSHQPNLKSGLVSWLDLILRKIAHVVEYGVLTWLLIRALSSAKEKKISKKTLIIAGVIAILYAISDEYHQTFILGREGAIRDVMVDGVGILGMAVSIFRWRKDLANKC